MAGLFNAGDFRLSSGEASNFLIDCNALTDDDLAALAVMVRDWVGLFTHVEGVPEGGLRFAEQLQKFCKASDFERRLLVDDVWTTGRSMQEYAARPGAPVYHEFLVIFGRRPPPAPMRCLFLMAAGNYPL